QRFQEETVRYLYLMQVVGGGDAESGGIPPGGRGPEIDGSGNGSGPQGSGPSTPGRARQRATSIDDMEQEFQRRKRRELDQAKMAGGGEVTQVQQVVRTTEKVRPNEPCPCGSGKKYKKCHGIE